MCFQVICFCSKNGLILVFLYLYIFVRLNWLILYCWRQLKTLPFFPSSIVFSPIETLQIHYFSRNREKQLNPILLKLFWIHLFFTMYVPFKIKLVTFALLTQCNWAPGTLHLQGFTEAKDSHVTLITLLLNGELCQSIVVLIICPVSPFIRAVRP